MPIARTICLLVALAFVVPSASWAQSVPLGMDMDVLKKTNDRQKISYGEETEQILRQGLKKILRMIEDAERRKDIVLLNCLNDKLAAVKGLMKVVDDANLGVQEAVARKNADIVDHEFRKVVIARTQGELFIREADSCIGDVGTSYPGQTRIQWNYDGDEGSDEIDELFPPIDFIDIVRPPAVSPYL